MLSTEEPASIFVQREEKKDIPRLPGSRGIQGHTDSFNCTVYVKADPAMSASLVPSGRSRSGVNARTRSPLWDGHAEYKPSSRTGDTLKIPAYICVTLLTILLQFCTVSNILQHVQRSPQVKYMRPGNPEKHIKYFLKIHPGMMVTK